MALFGLLVIGVAIIAGFVLWALDRFPDHDKLSDLHETKDSRRG